MDFFKEEYLIRNFLQIILDQMPSRSKKKKIFYNMFFISNTNKIQRYRK